MFRPTLSKSVPAQPRRGSGWVFTAGFLPRPTYSRPTTLDFGVRPAHEASQDPRNGDLGRKMLQLRFHGTVNCDLLVEHTRLNTECHHMQPRKIGDHGIVLSCRRRSPNCGTGLINSTITHPPCPVGLRSETVWCCQYGHFSPTVSNFHRDSLGIWLRYI